MSSMSGRGSGLGNPAHPQTANMGPVPSLGRPGSTQHGDTGMGSQVQEKVQDLAAGAADVAGQVRDTARRWAGSAAEAMEHGWDSTRQSVAGAWDEAGAFIRRHPIACLAAAFGMGALVASFLTAECVSRNTYQRYE
jgi:hypothetical protein